MDTNGHAPDPIGAAIAQASAQDRIAQLEATVNHLTRVLGTLIVAGGGQVVIPLAAHAQAIRLTSERNEDLQAERWTAILVGNPVPRIALPGGAAGQN